ncbi:MAG: MBOAT family protein, partial [Lachnospiraceae bacterium]|nr:MBOAT family protein [Lachnospiraceae bacterium]
LSEVRLFNGTRIIRSLSFITWGLFLKLVIADRIGLFVDNVYMDHSLYSGITLFLTAVLYSVQIYCDFAGYTDIMIGISELFGISLSQNFKTPYLASNISEFWRGWHMTLSSFLRDYIYIPLGGNRKGDLRKYINIMIVFLVCGFWHGNGYKFLAWGLLHGIFSVLTDLASKSRLSILVKGIPGTVINFFLVTFAWIFFRADSLSQAVSFILAMISGNSSSAGLMADIKLMEIGSIEIHIAIVSMIILFIADYMAASKKTDVPELICNTGEIKRDMVFVFISVIVLIFGKYGETDIGKFIYMAF